ncbi:hypothetical protein EV424DRAFT_1327699, partial [Suillus variegatus]
EAVIGLFLCFMQHVQYHLTNNMVYLSDFQGSGNLLTDLSRAFMNNFGRGNYISAFNSFRSAHKCNKFCHTFNLQPFTT